MLVIPVDLSVGFVGQTSPLSHPFGRHSSLLRATISRLLAADLGPVWVCSRDTPLNHGIDRLLDGLGVRALYGDATRSILSSVTADAGAPVLLIDPRCGFISATLLRQQLERHHAQRPDLTLCPKAARGLGGVVASLAALRQIDDALTRESQRCVDGDLFAFIEHFRSMLQVSDLDCDVRFACHVANLCPRTIAEARTLERFALPDDSEAYDAVFDGLAADAWRARRAGPPRRPSARPRILMAHYTQRRAPGSTRVFETVVRHWDRERWDLVAAVPGEGELLRALGELGTRVVECPFEGIVAEHKEEIGHRFVQEIDACIDLVASVVPDVIYVSGTLPALAVAARQLGIPTLCHMHLPMLTCNLALSTHWCRRSGLPLYDKVVLAAAWYRDALAQLFRPPPGRMSSIHCGIDLDVFRPGATDRAAARRSFGLPADAPIVAVAGMLYPFKRPELAIDCLPALPGVCLVFAGEEAVTGYRARMQDRADALGVGDRIRFLGHVSLPALFPAVELLLHCNVDEPFGLVLVEAMAMKLPVVAPDSTGAREIVVHGETGLLFPPTADGAQIATLIRSVITDRQLAAKLGEAGHQRAHEHFGNDLFFRRLEQACRELLP
jgi:glycosyltransferase involved in cell wall biosynthesis